MVTSSQRSWWLIHHREISVSGHTSRPNGYIVRKFKDPSDENSAFLPDQVHTNDFECNGLGYEADAFARCLRGEPSTRYEDNRKT